MNLISISDGIKTKKHTQTSKFSTFNWILIGNKIYNIFGGKSPKVNFYLKLFFFVVSQSLRY